MQAIRRAITVDEDNALHIAAIPFRAGSVVEVIILEQEPPQVLNRSERKLSMAQESALELIRNESASLGGRFPSRAELHEH